MGCEHKRLKSVNCVIFCADCGERLPVDYLVGRGSIAAQKAAETAPEAQTDEQTPEGAEAAETPVKGQKTARKKTAAKKTGK